MTMTLYGRRISIVISIIITSTKAEVMWSVRFLCHSVYMQDYCKSNQSIFIESYCYDCPTNRKNWLAIPERIQIPTHFSTSLTIAE